VTYTYGRIGGLARDLPEGWLARLSEILVQYEDFVGRVHGLMDRNRIFIDRMRDVGCLTTAEAINFGITGPLLRSTGSPRDLRKDTPTSPTPSSTSTSLSGSMAITTTVITCACARWTSRST
jgi:NADH-quinone oxidoreductase subunit D